MRHDFYSPKTQLAFRVSGRYTGKFAGQFAKVTEISQGAEEFAAWAGVPLARVYLYVIHKSRRYQGRQVFCAGGIGAAPEGALELDNDWTMETWLED